MTTLDQYAWHPVTPRTSDEQLTAVIRAINLRCREHDRAREDRTALRARIDTLYPEVIRRIRAHRDPQDASPMLQALYALIYQRSFDEADRGPKAWRTALLEHTHRLLLAYREQPRLDLLAFTTHLRVYATLCRDRHIERAAYQELKTRMDQALDTLLAPQTVPPTPEAHITASLPRLLVQGDPFIDGPRDAQWTAIYAALSRTILPERLPNAALLRWIRLLTNLPHWYLEVPGNCEELLEQAEKELEKREGDDVVIEQLIRKRRETVTL